MERNLKRTLIALLLVLLAVISALPVADLAAAPETHAATIASIDDKTATVLKLTAVSALASTAVSAAPGDLATPISEKLADFSEYFLLILCVLFAEKYLLSLVGYGAFRVLVPLACLLAAASLFVRPRTLRRIAGKAAVFGLALFLVIPLSIRASDLIYGVYQDSINATIASAEQLSEENAAEEEAEEAEGSTILSRVSESVTSLTDRAANMVRRFVETLAIMIVTSCLIPLLVLVFFFWLIKLITGMDPAVFLPPRHSSEARTPPAPPAGSA